MQRFGKLRQCGAFKGIFQMENLLILEVFCPEITQLYDSIRFLLTLKDSSSLCPYSLSHQMTLCAKGNHRGLNQPKGQLTYFDDRIDLVFSIILHQVYVV